MSTLQAIHNTKSKHQSIPLIFIQIDATNSQRPLKFAEPILDALGCYYHHELIVDIKELKPKQSDIKTNIIISKHNDNFTTKMHQSNKSVLLINDLIKQFDVKNDESIKTILGHSKFSPVRRLKQYILKQENVSYSTDGKSNHDNFVQSLSKYVDPMAYPKLATVIILMDCDKNILLTRRHSKLRSFPSCWVVPGGSVDPGEEIKDTAKREVFEEVGINIDDDIDSKDNINDNMEMIAIWESIYPDSKRFDVVNNKTIKYHHFVPIFVYQLNQHYSKYKLKLCEIEVECAIWISSDILKDIINADQIKNSKLNGVKPNGDLIDIELQCFHGIYPNDIGQGIARGHLYGIKKLLDRL